jgi:hypothetical protein
VTDATRARRERPAYELRDPVAPPVMPGKVTTSPADHREDITVAEGYVVHA